jgi:hypothetical protein
LDDTGTPPGDTSVPPGDTSIPPGCEFDRRCEDDTLVVCDAGTQTRVPCRLGCTDGDGGATCREMIPSNVEPSLWMADAEDVTIESRVGLNTTDCSPTSAIATVVRQVDGPELCVLSTGAFRITEDGTLFVHGSRPLVIMAAGDVRIDGLLDASATDVEAGPGGYRGGSEGGAVEMWGGDGPHGGEVGAHEGSFDDGGGGGGGFCGAGGAGGAGGTIPALGGAGGGTAPLSWELSPLYGGSGGGRGRGAFLSTGTNAGFGGAGGGALQISTRSRIRISGQILVGGGGGLPGQNLFGTTQNWGSGGGAGSGGAVLLEASEVEIDAGRIIAAGGGGGGSAGSRSGLPGQDGRAAGLGRADGGAGDDVLGADGGDGSSPTELSGEQGGQNPRLNGNGAGGGGGAGCILIRTADATLEGSPEAHPSVAPAYRQLVVRTR